MKGLKASLALIIVTILTCIVIVVTSSGMSKTGLKKTNAVAAANYSTTDILMEEGTFAPDIFYEYANNKDIYHIKYDDRSSIKLYDIAGGKSEIILTPIKPENKIHAFYKYSDYFIWEEDGASDESERVERVDDWDLYLRKGNEITKIDTCGILDIDPKININLPPQKLSAYDNYLVYKTYDGIPYTGKSGAVIKLYDMSKETYKVIFSLEDIKGIEISEPCIYKNYVVWSTSTVMQGDIENLKTGDMYIYNINANSYTKVSEKSNLLDPVIWEDYIVCSRYGDKGPSVVVMNIKTGALKDVAFSDYSVFPKKEVHDYSVGGGYVTWNNSYADSVNVYDIVNDSTLELKRCKPSSNADNSLLNIKLYGKTLLYTDHIFSKSNGRTISEVNRYIILR